MSLSCGCDDGEGPEVFNEKLVKASKDHKCCECGRTISKGEVYNYIFGVWEGDAMTFKTCEECNDLRDSLEAMGFCFSFGDLKASHQEYISEYVNNGNP